MGGLGTITQDNMNIPYDEWGEQLNGANIQLVKDANGTVIGNIEDVLRTESEPVHRKATKADALRYADEWKNDDGTYGTGDEAIYIAYEDGKFLNLTDGDPHKRWSKQGISGISISTGDDEMVWGGEWVRRPYKQPEFQPYTTHEFDDDGNEIEGYQNSHSYYRTKNVWLERVKTTYTRNERGRNVTQREVLRRSTKKSWNS